MSLLTGWNGVLVAASVAATLATIAQAVAVRRRDDGLDRIAGRMMVVAAALAGAAFLWLMGRFIVLDLSYEYVFLYTSTRIPLSYRIAGTWTGREGSLLLWAAWLALVAAVLAWWHRRRPVDEEATSSARAWTRLLLYGMTAVFLLAVARQDTFAVTDPFFLQGRPGGNGLNPTLLSPFMIIHPPIMFLAYALTTVPLAAGLAHLVTGTDRWSTVAQGPSRLNWILYTFAMGLGGVWAYYTLGFGGYWAWDPVEVANFLPWLALTVYLHAQLHHRQHGRYRAIGPFLAALPFLLTMFSTVSTRSGLWVSVHAFTDPTNAFDPDSASRLLGILEADPSLQPYMGIIGATFLGMLALWCRRLALDHGVMPRASRAIAGVLGTLGLFAALAPMAFLSAAFELGHRLTGGRTGMGALGLLLLAGLAAASPTLVAPEEPGSKRPFRVDLKTLLYGSVLTLGLLLIVAFLFHMAAVNGWDRAFWEARVPWLATPVALLLVVLFLHAHRGRRVAMMVAGAAWLVAGLAFLVSGLGAYAVALSAAVLAAGIDKLAKVAFVGDVRARLGSTLLWAASALDVVFWLAPPRIAWLDWTPLWPWQIPMGALALVALWGAHRNGLGRRDLWPYVLAGALGAYYVAPLLAAAAWILHRRASPLRVQGGPARWRPIGVYGIHLVVGLLFVGYSMSTYFAHDVRGELVEGESLQVGSGMLHFEGARLEAQEATPWAATVLPEFSLTDDGGRRGAVEGILYWEPQTGSHYPLPATLRMWDRDLYVSIDAVCIDPEGACDRSVHWVTAYESTNRIAMSDDITGVRVHALSLPGVSLVWASLALFVTYAVPILVAARRTKGGA